MSTYKEELRVLLGEGYKLADAHLELKSRRNIEALGENPSSAQMEEIDNNPLLEEISIELTELQLGETIPCPECNTGIGITMNYLNNREKRGLHCYQCNRPFNP